MKISLLIVATEKYIKFLPDLVESARKYFISNQEVIIHIFSNRVKDCELLLSQMPEGKTLFHEVDHKPWPYATLYRFHFFKKYIEEIKGEYVFYIDADTIIKSPITEEILSPRTAVQHCGFVNGGGSWETRPNSKSYVSPEQKNTYYGGGFWGFGIMNFKTIIDYAIEMIDEDAENGIVPVYHDESVLNKILTIIPPMKVLSPSYHWPDKNPRIWASWKEQYECKILLLHKDHKVYQV